MDRRGHGASGDSPDYSLRKEAEDVAAVVDSMPGPVFVLGHSYGAVCALEATFLTNKIARLILYEPPVEEPADFDRAMADSIDRLIRAGARDEAVVTFLGEVVKQSPSEIATMRSRPSWTGLVSTIDGQPRQMRALASYRFDAKRMGSVRMPVLLLTGSDTASPYLKKSIASLQASLPHPTLVVLAGQQHNAMDSGRENLAATMVRFLAAESTRTR
jgi:pimeloyl-ACP methyl ester carboxylesterase